MNERKGSAYLGGSEAHYDCTGISVWNAKLSKLQVCSEPSCPKGSLAVNCTVLSLTDWQDQGVCYEQVEPFLAENNGNQKIISLLPPSEKCSQFLQLQKAMLILD